MGAWSRREKLRPTPANVFLGFSKGAEQNVLRGLGQLRSKISDNLSEQLVADDFPWFGCWYASKVAEYGGTDSSKQREASRTWVNSCEQLSKSPKYTI